jgi:hypothetical protein
MSDKTELLALIDQGERDDRCSASFADELRTTIAARLDVAEDVGELLNLLRMKAKLFEPFVEIDPDYLAAAADTIERLSRERDEARARVKPFADAVYNDNGDVTITPPTTEAYLAAHRGAAEWKI